MNNNGNVLGIIAIVIAAVALVLSFVAFNRTSEDRIENVAEDKVEETFQGLFGQQSPQPQPEEEGGGEADTEGGGAGETQE